MIKLSLNPALNKQKSFPIGTILKPTNSLIKATGTTNTSTDIYVKVTQDKRTYEPCRNCFLKKTPKCSDVFSCVTGEHIILQVCNERGDLIGN